MFRDRRDAGRQLAQRLTHLKDDDVVVVGLPRGGVPVASEVAAALGAPLDVILVRKLGVPYQPEVAMGAIGEDGVKVLNDRVLQMARVADGELAAIEQRERAELERRGLLYRANRPRVALRGRVVAVIDDGIATGSTATAACQVARAEGARRVVLAVPVAPADWTDRLAGEADELISLETPTDFMSVGQFYRDFGQTTDEEVIGCLADSGIPTDAKIAPTLDDPPARDEDVTITLGDKKLGGHLTVPEQAKAMVIFAHGSGSSRHSSRNRYVAAALNKAGLATLLFDLLTPDEEHDRANVFDIELLGHRLAAVTGAILNEPGLDKLSVAYFGASTGAAAALRAATDLTVPVAAVVSRGGRPDLAGAYLDSVSAPTLLIVGGNDPVVLDLNKEAQTHMHCESQLTVIPGASHLFEEPGTLQMAAELARDWFLTHLG